jgi:hypothetical protein
MTGERSKRAQSYHPDPFDIQIGALVVLHRAALLSQDAATHDALIEIANDYRWYGQLLEQQSGTQPPWDRNSKNGVTPPRAIPGDCRFDWSHTIHSKTFPRHGLPTLPVDGSRRSQECAFRPNAQDGALSCCR